MAAVGATGEELQVSNEGPCLALLAVLLGGCCRPAVPLEESLEGAAQQACEALLSLYPRNPCGTKVSQP